MGPLAKLREFTRDKRGAALVEFTLAAPLLIGLMCGLAEFGQALRQYHVMEKGVRDAGRFLSRVPASPPCTGIIDPTWPTAITQARNLAVYGSTTSSTPLFKGWTDPLTVTVADPACVANPRGGVLPVVTVAAAAPYVDLGMLSILGLRAPTLRVSHQEVKVS